MSLTKDEILSINQAGLSTDIKMAATIAVAALKGILELSASIGKNVDQITVDDIISQIKKEKL